MSAHQSTRSLMIDFERRLGKLVTFDDANTLRRAQLTLRSWAEGECGNSNDYGSWAIERDENDLPYRVHHHWAHGQGKDSVTRYRIPDREAGALARVKAVCGRNGLHYYHQTDPRGCALYVHTEPLDGSNYNRGVACCD